MLIADEEKRATWLGSPVVLLAQAGAVALLAVPAAVALAADFIPGAGHEFARSAAHIADAGAVAGGAGFVTLRFLRFHIRPFP